LGIEKLNVLPLPAIAPAQAGGFLHEEDIHFIVAHRKENSPILLTLSSQFLFYLN